MQEIIYTIKSIWLNRSPYTTSSHNITIKYGSDKRHNLM